MDDGWIQSRRRWPRGWSCYPTTVATSWNSTSFSFSSKTMAIPIILRYLTCATKRLLAAIESNELLGILLFAHVSRESCLPTLHDACRTGGTTTSSFETTAKSQPRAHWLHNNGLYWFPVYLAGTCLVVQVVDRPSLQLPVLLRHGGQKDRFSKAFIMKTKSIAFWIHWFDAKGLKEGGTDARIRLDFNILWTSLRLDLYATQPARNQWIDSQVNQVFAPKPTKVPKKRPTDLGQEGSLGLRWMKFPPVEVKFMISLLIMFSSSTLMPSSSSDNALPEDGVFEVDDYLTFADDGHEEASLSHPSVHRYPLVQAAGCAANKTKITDCNKQVFRPSLTLVGLSLDSWMFNDIYFTLFLVFHMRSIMQKQGCRKEIFEEKQQF